LKTKRLYQTVADDLLKVIKSGKYKVGDRLPAERDLASEFKVSRPTMREAVIALEIAGQVEVRKGSGVYVVDGDNQNQFNTGTSTKLSSDLDVGAFELTEARMLFESEAAALAATMITDEELNLLADTIDSMQAENEKGVDGELADREFHMIIAQATRNSAVVATIEELWNLRERSELTRRMYKVVRQKGVRPDVEEHRKILDALKKKKPAEARAAMRSHLSRVIDYLLEATEMEAVEEAVEEIRKQMSADRYRFSRVLNT